MSFLGLFVISLVIYLFTVRLDVLRRAYVTWGKLQTSVNLSLLIS